LAQSKLLRWIMGR